MKLFDIEVNNYSMHDYPRVINENIDHIDSELINIGNFSKQEKIQYLFDLIEEIKQEQEEKEKQLECLIDINWTVHERGNAVGFICDILETQYGVS